MDVFYKLDIDPSHVIGLYSDLLPSEFINQVIMCTDVLNQFEYDLKFGSILPASGFHRLE